MSSDPIAPSPLSADNPLMPRLYQAAIGPLQTAYYQQQFERFDALGKPLPSWNWAAGCCTLGWMALRGMWRHAAIYAGVLLAIVGLVWALGLHRLLPLPAALALGLLLVLLAVVAPGLGGNALYHRVVRERTMQALTQSRTLGDAMAQLQTQAPTPTRLQWAAAGQVLSALLVAGLVWAMGSSSSTPRPNPTGPTQQDTARALAALAPAVTPPTAAAPTAATAPLAAPSAEAPPAHQPAAAPAPTSSAPLSAPAPELPALQATSGAVPTEPVPSTPDTKTPLTTPSPSPSTPPAPTVAATDAATAAPASPAKNDKAGKMAKSEAAKEKAREKLAADSAKDKAPSTANKASKTEKTAKSSKSSDPGNQQRTANKTMLQPGQYYLNTGIYAQSDNAKRVVRQLRDAGQPVFTQSLESRRGEVTRIRVGPFESRTQAEAAAAKIHALKLEAQIFRHAPN